jgi:hypothetical protein
MITIFVAAFAAESEAINCYNCEVQDDRFVGLTFHDCRYSLIECPAEFDVCLKTSVNNKVTRTCGKSLKNPAKDTEKLGCLKSNVTSVILGSGFDANLVSNSFTVLSDNPTTLLAKQSCCSTSECNSTNTLVNNKFILAAFLFVAALLYKQ